MTLSFPQTLIERFDNPEVDALVLLGSYAHGAAHRYSDVDIARFTNANGHGRTHTFRGLIDDRLVNVNDLGSDAVEDTFTKPDMASSYLAGLRLGRPLRDRNQTFAAIQARAHDFVWDEKMQQKANDWASENLADWAEDMRKGLAGLITRDTGQLLSACFAGSWGLSRIMQIQRGVLLASGHDFYAAVGNAVGVNSEWVRLRQIAFAISNAKGVVPNLIEQVTAGLQLYCETARLLAPVLRPGDTPLIAHTVTLIREGLSTPQVLRSMQL